MWEKETVVFERIEEGVWQFVNVLTRVRARDVVLAELYRGIFVPHIVDPHRRHLILRRERKPRKMAAMKDFLRWLTIPAHIGRHSMAYTEAYT